MAAQFRQTGLRTILIIASAILAAVIIYRITAFKPVGSPPVPAHEHSSDNPALESDSPATQTNARITLQQIIANARTWGPVRQSLYGQPAPNFTLEDLEGNLHKLSDYRGKTIMLVFWATWCPPCLMEIPHLITLRNRISTEKLEILAITNENPEKISDFTKKKRINYTVLLDKNDMPAPFGVMRIYGSTGIPGSFFINPDGKIKLATAGLLTLGDMKAIIQAK